MTPLLLPWYLPPTAWGSTGLAGGALTGGRPTRELTVVVSDPDDPATVAPAAALARAGATVLGRVDAGFAERPLADLLDEVAGWACRPVAGIFLDRAPTSAYCLGPVALAARSARRAGLTTVMLNPGVPVDECYRELRVPICTFEGSWVEYRRWSGTGTRRGDGHLVHSVPAGELPAAWELLRRRGAGFGLATDRRPPSGPARAAAGY